MFSIYKYFDDESYALDLIERGRLHLKSLAHFRGYEDGSVRGDPDDGSLHYQPEQGLRLNKVDGEVVTLPNPWRLKASARAEEIFVYCSSLERSEVLAERFQSAFCVEIRDADALFAKTKGCVRLRSKLDCHVYRGNVEYRDPIRDPLGDWALPERVAFNKPPAWSWQKEYRMVVGLKGAFAVENVDLALENGPQDFRSAAVTAPLNLAVGALSRITQLHRF
jgi:hypothetical protein